MRLSPLGWSGINFGVGDTKIDFRTVPPQNFSDDVTRLDGTGVVWELAFGNWVLLQPERISPYAQAGIRRLQVDECQRGR